MSFECRCGHNPSSHGVVDYPKRARPCERCVNCGGRVGSRACCLAPKRCSCENLDQSVARWEHPRDAAAEAVVWGLIASVAEENKKAARDYLTEHLTRENSRGVDAVANGNVIGSVTRSKPSEKLDVTDWPEFVRYMIFHHPEMLTVEYRVKETFLRRVIEVDGKFIEPEIGEEIPGLGRRVSSGTVKVNPDDGARERVRELLSGGHIQGWLLPALEVSK